MNLRLGTALTTSPIHGPKPVKDHAELSDEISAGAITFVNGAFNTSIIADAESQNLYNAHFSGIYPGIQSLNGNITLDYEPGIGSFDLKNAKGKISLNSLIPWSLFFHGGVAGVRADLRELKLNRIQINGGVNHFRLLLPEPVGDIPIYITGGVNSLTISCPVGTNTRLHVLGGSTALSFDQQKVMIVCDEILLKTPSFNHVDNQYNIRVNGGSRNLTINRQGME